MPTFLEGQDFIIPSLSPPQECSSCLSPFSCIFIFIFLSPGSFPALHVYYYFPIFKNLLNLHLHFSLLYPKTCLYSLTPISLHQAIFVSPHTPWQSYQALISLLTCPISYIRHSRPPSPPCSLKPSPAT